MGSWKIAAATTSKPIAVDFDVPDIACRLRNQITSKKLPPVLAMISESRTRATFCTLFPASFHIKGPEKATTLSDMSVTVVLAAVEQSLPYRAIEADIGRLYLPKFLDSFDYFERESYQRSPFEKRGSLHCIGQGNALEADWTGRYRNVTDPKDPVHSEQPDIWEFKLSPRKSIDRVLSVLDSLNFIGEYTQPPVALVVLSKGSYLLHPKDWRPLTREEEARKHTRLIAAVA